MWSIFKRKSMPRAPKQEAKEFRFRHFGVDSVTTEGALIPEISANHLDGFVYQKFFSAEQCAAILASVERTETDIKTVTPFGKVIGKRLESGDGNFQKLPLDSYFERSALWRKEMPEVLGMDLESELKQRLDELAGKAEIALPVDDEGRAWNPATVRVIQPGGAGIQTHVGNEFNEKMEDNRHLARLAVIHDQLSFFVLLQKPGSGGDLHLFDAYWDETEHLVNQSHEAAVGEVESRATWTVPMEAGDLLVFGGGRIWHRVLPVTAGPARVTLGGFLAPSRDGNRLYHWS
jgi:hypothetical protein